MIGAYFGHQHVEGFTGTYDGVELGLTYGMEFAKTGPYGYRVLTLHEDDITHYENELYTYTGSVKLGTDRIEKQNDEPSPAPTGIMKLIAYIRNILNTYCAGACQSAISKYTWCRRFEDLEA